MSVVMAATGTRSVKIVNGQRREVVPFVGADHEGEFSSLGVGFMDKGYGQIWGLVAPHALIQSWRAMKILEHVPMVVHGTLCCCWYAASEHPHDSDCQRIDELADQFPSREEFDAIMAKVMEAVPTNDELETMLTALREKSVQVDGYELTRLIKAGKLAPNALVEEIVQEEEARCRQYQEEEAIIKEPMAPENSLTVFFGDLGIANFIIGGGIGGYGMDWGHIELKKLDEAAKRDCLSKYLKGFDLEHTTQGPEATATAVGPGVTMFMTSFGEIERPWYVAADGAKYTFSKVVLHEGSFLVTTKIEKEGAESAEGQYSIPQLREMIGLFPPKSQPVSEKKRSRFRWPCLFGG